MNKKITQSLVHDWEFQHPEENKWYPAKVPGCIHLDLIEEGLIGDPFFGDNEKQIQWIGKINWKYRLYFYLDQTLKKRSNKKIKFYGIDTYATIYLNGHIILESNNMFHPWENDVTQILKKGKNELLVNFRSPLNEILPSLSTKAYTLPAENDRAGGTSPYTRKAPYHYGWDWGPCLISSGIWKKVELIGWNSWNITNIFIEQLECSSGSAKLKFLVYIESKVQETGTLVISEPKSKTNIHYPIQINSEENIFTYEIEILDPDLWWPIGYGDQSLYTFNIKVITQSNSAEITKRIGIRSIKIKREKDERGTSFEIHINDVAIFAKGANWIPADSFTPRLKNEDYKSLLKSAVLANMNMLRIWGGGIYEPDSFYSLCDELGILIWQDFMFACSLYPGNKNFLKSVKKEAQYQINRLKHHPSIVLWCGNNEIASAWLSWGWKEKLPKSVWRKDYNILFHQIIPEICQSLDPERLYWPSSPGHSLELPESDQIYGSGDNHYWGVWHGGDEIERFDENIGRFMSEYGMQSFPEPKTIATFAKKKDWDIKSEVIKSHQKASLGNKNITKYIDMYYPTPKDFKSYAMISQIMQALVIRYAVEAHRRNMPYCMGTLYWQFNDCWPGASWSSIDYFGNWKALQYAAKKFFNPLLLSIVEENNSIVFYIINDCNKSSLAIINLFIYSFDGNIKKKLSKKIDIPSSRSKKVLEIEREKLITSYDPTTIVLISEIEENNIIVAKNNFFFVKPKELKLEKPEIDFNYEKLGAKYVISIYSKTFIHELHILCENLTGIFTDNFFDLLPEKLVKIEFEPSHNDYEIAPIFTVNSLHGLTA
ncbi:MAG: beta-galactosidase [Candidatus Marinimicrobia bacterium]|nr:beta-galactosidase [Candidatus Neomarinimicrobiota bacterium]